VHRRFVPAWFFPKTLLVERESANRHFGPGRLLPGHDHFSTVKPPSADHPAHRLLVEFSDGQFKEAVARRQELDKPVTKSSAVVRITPQNLKDFANSNFEAHRLIVDGADLALAPRAEIKANEIELTNGAKITGSQFHIVVGRLSGGSVTADGPAGQRGKPGGDGGRILVIGRQIDETTFSARGGRGGSGIRPGAPGLPGGRGGEVVVILSGTLDSRPDVSGGVGGEVSGPNGPEGDGKVHSVAESRADLMLTSASTDGPEPTINALMRAPAEFTTQVRFASSGSPELSDEGRRQLDQLVELLKKDADSWIVFTPTSGPNNQNAFELNQQQAEHVFDYLTGRGVDKNRITAMHSASMTSPRSFMGSAWIARIPSLINPYQ
jgi:hypothetical protein